MPITPEFALVAALATGVGLSMTRLGVGMITTKPCAYCTQP